MFMVGAAALLAGYFIGRWGIEAMIDPSSPIHRAGGIRVLCGRALSLFGLGTCAIGAVWRLVAE